MCVGGCPAAEDPVVAAARVARLAQDFVRTAAGFVSQDGLKIKIRVGLHSGGCQAGRVE